MRRCVVHIGWHKTGSTALQHFLHEVSPSLADHGVVYPVQARNHSAFLPSALLHDSEPTYSEVFVPPLAGHESEPRRVASRSIVEDVIADDHDGTLVLSAEDLCLLDLPAVRRCRSLLADAFDRIDIVVYLRDHAGYARSAAQQLLRMGFQWHEVVGMARSGRSPIAVLEPLPHYGPRLERWVSVFGADAISVFHYDTVAARGTSIQEHFLEDVLGLDHEWLDVAASYPRTNASFTKPAAYVLDRMNAACPLFVDDHPNPGWQFNRQRFLAQLPGSPFDVGAELFEPVAAAHAADTAQLQGRARARRSTSAGTDARRLRRRGAVRE